jgi:hypothetical protein
MNCAQISNSGNNVPRIPEQDWNFDNIPNEELVACCYWEYARESKFICEALREYRDWFWAGGLRSQDTTDCCGKLEQIQGIGYVAEVFVRGCVYEPVAQNRPEHPSEPPDSHPEASKITGSFPAPWQSLSLAERKERSQIRSERTTIPLVPFERGERHEAREIADWAESRWHEWNDAYAKVKRDHPEIAEGQLLEQGKLKSFPGIQPSLYWEGGREVTVVSIHWSDFTNEEIVQYFRRWVKENRPNHWSNPDTRGHKSKDWRAQLTRLAVMRLLSRFTALQLVSDDLFPEIWATKQFSGRKWGDVTKWHDARREARKTFQILFPFLPEGELPFSWKRPAPLK